MIHRPVMIGLTLCDQVIIEEGSRNITLVNCFTRFYVEQFPSVPRRFTAFAACTDGLGEMVIDLVINRLDTFEEIYIQSHRVRFQDRLQETRLLFRINRCSFPGSGEYQISLIAEGELATQRKLHVLAKEN